MHRPKSSIPIDETLRALETTVTDEDRKRVDTIFEPGTHVSNYYSADFGPNARWQ
jgi:hypothetical protein